MKKTFFYICLLISCFGFAQKYQVTYSGQVTAEPCDPDPIQNSINQISISNLPGVMLNPLLTADCFNLAVSANNETSIINFLPDRAIKRKYAETLSGSVIIDQFEEVISPFNHCDNKTIVFPNSGNVFQIAIEPITEIINQSDNNALCEITLSVDEDGFAPEVYVWQYFDNISSQWIDFPNNLQGVHEVTFNLVDLFGNQASNYNNTNIQFRMQRYCTGKYTNIISYTMISCSPQLISFSPSDTQCSYTSDGGFTANFDRNLNPGEELIMTLYRIESDGSEVLINQESTTTLGAANTYIWPLAQPAANYLIKYQTESGGVFSSLETTDPFTISSPSPVTFTATKLNDVYCKNGNDAAIELGATGGVGGFEYELNSSGVWLPFATNNNHTISNLPQGSKTIKVRDANQCTEQE